MDISRAFVTSCGLATLLVGLLSGCAARAGAVIETQKLVLRDPAGHVRAVLATDADATQLDLFDSAGKPRAALSVGADGVPSLALYDGQGKSRAGVGLATDGAPAIVLYDQDGKPRAVIGSAQLRKTSKGDVKKTDPSSIVFVDGEGKVIFKAPP